MFLTRRLARHRSFHLMTDDRAIAGPFVAVVLCASVTASCGDDNPVAVEPRGTIEVLTTTMGERLDPDGYLVTIDESTLPELNWEVGIQDQLVLRDLLTGPHFVWLRDVAGNCTVTAENPRSVEVSASSMTTSAFEIECLATIGGIRFNTSTVGEEPDLTGYTATIDGTQVVQLPTNGTVLVEEVAATNHVVAVSEIAANCALLNSNPLEVWVREDEVLEVRFLLECAATTGTLRVTTLTEGVDLDSDGYQVELLGFGSVAIRPNDEVLFDRVPPGTYVLQLTDVSENCAIQNLNPRVANILVGYYPTAEFSLVCLGGDSLTDQIVFESYHDDYLGDVYAIGTDGEGLVRLINHPARQDRVPDVSPDGRHIALTSNWYTIQTTGWLGENRQNLTANLDCCSDKPDWSPDGTMIAYHSDREQQTEIYVTDVTGSSHTRLTFTTSFNLMPAWSPDGSRIAFMSDRTGDFNIFVMNADGSEVIQLTTDPGYDGMPDWSADNRIAFVSNRDGNREVYVMNADGSGPSNLTNNPAEDEQPAWSRDASRLAFVRDFSVWLMNGDGSDQIHLTVGLDQAVHPSWSP